MGFFFGALVVANGNGGRELNDMSQVNKVMLFFSEFCSEILFRTVLSSIRSQSSTTFSGKAKRSFTSLLTHPDIPFGLKTLLKLTVSSFFRQKINFF